MFTSSVLTKEHLSDTKIGSYAKTACKTMYFCYANTISSIYYPKIKTEIKYSSKDRGYF